MQPSQGSGAASHRLGIASVAAGILGSAGLACQVGPVLLSLFSRVDKLQRLTPDILEFMVVSTDSISSSITLTRPIFCTNGNESFHMASSPEEIES
jgi:hypothetical protein